MEGSRTAVMTKNVLNKSHSCTSDNSKVVSLVLRIQGFLLLQLSRLGRTAVLSAEVC